MATLDVVPLGTDWEFSFDLTTRATATGKSTPATGLGGLQAWFSASKGGAALGSTTTSLTERSGTPGQYFGILDQATLSAALTASANSVVFEVIAKSGDILAARQVIVQAVQDIAVP